MGEESGQLYRILDKNLVRSNQLGSWTAPDIVKFEYWDVRYNLPHYVMSGIDATIDYIVEKYNIVGKLTDTEKFSFFFHIKDELVRVSEMERTGQAALVSQLPIVKSKSKIKPSPRRQVFPEIMELALLSGKDPIKAAAIKRLPYEDVWETLLAIAIEREDEYPTG